MSPTFLDYLSAGGLTILALMFLVLLIFLIKEYWRTILRLLFYIGLLVISVGISIGLVYLIGRLVYLFIK